MGPTGLLCSVFVVNLVCFYSLYKVTPLQCRPAWE